MNQSAESIHLVLDNKNAYSGAFTLDTTYRVNIKALFGDMFYKYTKFKINLDSMVIYVQNVAGNALVTGLRVCNVRISGFNFINNGGILTKEYPATVIVPNDTPIGNSESSFPQGLQLSTIANETYINFPSINNSLTIARPESTTVDIRIYFMEPSQNKQPYNNVSRAQIVSSFSIYGLYD